MQDGSEKTNVHDPDTPSYGTNCEPNDVSGSEDFDILEKTIGGFGKWQLKIIILMSLLKIPLAWTQLNIVFIAPRAQFWCKAPEIFENVPVNEWKSMIDVKNTTGNFTYEYSCYMENVFNNSTNSTVLPCLWGYEYNRTDMVSSIITEWDLVCDRGIMVEITQMITMFGILLGMIVFGTTADKYGRKNVLMIVIILHILCGLASSISPWYGIFLLFKFLTAFATSGFMAISFVMCLEVVAGSWGTSISIITHIPWGLGYSIMAVLAYAIRDWRYFQLTQYIVAFFFLTYYWFIPESPRWLLSVNRKKEAAEVLEEAAKENKKDIDKVLKTVKIYKEHIVADSVSVIHIFKHRKLGVRAFLLSLKWFINGIVYFGLYQLSGTTTDNKYLSVIIVGLISVPGNLSAVFIVKRFGRKPTLIAANICTALCGFAIIFVPKTTTYHMLVENVLVGIAIFGITISYPTLHLLSGECYPTVLRNSTVSINMMFSKLGGMLSPFVVSLSQANWRFPFIVFGVASILELFPLIFLPETLHMKLPDYIEDVENS